METETVSFICVSPTVPKIVPGTEQTHKKQLRNEVTLSISHVVDEKKGKETEARTKTSREGVEIGRHGTTQTNMIKGREEVMTYDKKALINRRN